MIVIIRQIYFLLLKSINILLTIQIHSIFRVLLLKLLGQNIAISASIHRGVIIKSLRPKSLSIGAKTIINRNVTLDNRGYLKIGKNVAISEYTRIYTAEHSMQGEDRPIVRKPVIIDDSVFIYSNVIVLPGTNLKEGSVIGSGAVVTKNIPKYEIWAGNPAKKIGDIDPLNFKNKFYGYFWAP